MILQSDNRKIMKKMLEIIGFVLLGIMTLSFVGALQPTIEPGLSPLFWGCAGATLMILIYRKRKQDEKEN